MIEAKIKERQLIEQAGFKYEKTFKFLKIPIDIQQQGFSDVTTGIHVIKFKLQKDEQWTENWKQKYEQQSIIWNLVDKINIWKKDKKDNKNNEQQEGKQNNDAKQKKIYQNVVFLHGYSAFSSYYIQLPIMLQQIINEQCKKKIEIHVNLYMIDIVGQGLSDRFEYQERNMTQTQDFFATFLEQTINKLSLKKFILIGHSFGGYISILYSIRQDSISKIQDLILLSPIGVTDKKYDWKSDDTKFQEKNGFFSKQWFDQCGKWAQQGMTPHDIGKNLQQRFYTKYILLKFIQTQLDFGNIPKEIINSIIELHCQMLLLPNGTEKAIHQFLDHRFVSKDSLEMKINEIQHDFCINTFFIYGDSDWNDHSGVQRIKQYNEKYKKNVKFFMFPNCGHQVLSQRPDLVKDVLEKRILCNM